MHIHGMHIESAHWRFITAVIIYNISLPIHEGRTVYFTFRSICTLGMLLRWLLRGDCSIRSDEPIKNNIGAKLLIQQWAGMLWTVWRIILLSSLRGFQSGQRDLTLRPPVHVHPNFSRKWQLCHATWRWMPSMWTPLQWEVKFCLSNMTPLLGLCKSLIIDCGWNLL